MGKNCISKVRDSALPKDIPSKQLKFFRIQTSLTQVWHNLGNDLKTFFQTRNSDHTKLRGSTPLHLPNYVGHSTPPLSQNPAMVKPPPPLPSPL